MACCLTAPSHYLNQFWLITSGVLWRSPQGNFTANASVIILYSDFENHISKFTATSPRGQWVKTETAFHSCWWWNQNFPGKLRQYYSCWCPGFLPRQRTSRHVLIMLDKKILVFLREGIQLPVSSQICEVIENANLFHVSWNQSRMVSVRVAIAWQGDDCYVGGLWMGRIGDTSQKAHAIKIM